MAEQRTDHDEIEVVEFVSQEGSDTEEGILEELEGN